ncbi:MAG: non-homologous end-joining DNA ligase [Pyrinomonadaceae bacterium]|nr:non-homologous end-joining DNA ligase [Pyrinomonadaceae bacterium]
MATKSKRVKALQTICDGARKAAMPVVIKPMLATLVDDPFSDPDWLFETKWDGVRAVCFIRNGKARFISRNQIEMTAQYPELADIAESIRGSSVVLDGEIVALDENGVSRFQLLQRRLGRKNAGEIERLAATTRIAFYIFDLLHLDGFDLMGCKLIERKETLEQILKASRNIRYSDHIIGEGERLFKEIAKVPLEGMIAKRLESVYTQRRSAEWLKIKTIQQSEVVIGGYTEPRNSREYFGALVVGLYRDGQLHYVAHTGGGFNHQTLAQTYKLMQSLKTKDCPFVDKPKTNEPVQWVKPKLVAQVKFSEWTADGRMRHPVFLGLRQDKKPEECVFEIKRDTDQVLSKTARKTKS